jgi:hypothetical protein
MPCSSEIVKLFGEISHLNLQGPSQARKQENKNNKKKKKKKAS